MVILFYTKYILKYQRWYHPDTGKTPNKGLCNNRWENSQACSLLN